ncbi:MAG TPA: hypothetical protein VFD58_12965 [Blastocatellia bacterium]|nr:hypothetical protein [Blastocatellia bacterium]
MASFRVRKPAEYLRILWNRRYYVLVPFLLVTATLSYTIYRLPNVYESTSLIIVDPPKVDSNIAPQANVDISARLGTLRQQVASRSNLDALINKYDLYKAMRAQKAPAEAVIEKMREHILIDIKNMGSGYNAFTISFQDQDREVVQAVTAELAAQFSDENLKKNLEVNNNTVAHLDDELTRVKQQLDGIIAQRTKYIVEHPPVMAGQTQSIVGEMNSLSQQILAQQTQIGNLQNNIANYQQMLTMVKDRYDEPVIENDSPAEGALRVKRAEVEATLQDLRTKYTEKHPDVKAAQVQLDKINKEMADLQKKAEDKKNGIKKSRQQNSQVDNVQLQIDATRRELERRQAELSKMNGEYAGLQAQLRSIPPLTAEMERIDRDYDTLKKQHDDLLARRQRAAFYGRLNSDFSGETFRIHDPANLPEAPVYPRRTLLYPLSLIFGLLSGLAVAMAFEARYLFTIRDAKDVEHYTRLPLLVTVPEIITEPEEQRRRMLGMVTVLAVIVLMVIAVPVMVKVIQYSRVLDVFIGGGY